MHSYPGGLVVARSPQLLGNAEVQYRASWPLKINCSHSYSSYNIILLVGWLAWNKNKLHPKLQLFTHTSARAVANLYMQSSCSHRKHTNCLTRDLKAHFILFLLAQSTRGTSQLTCCAWMEQHQKGSSREHRQQKAPFGSVVHSLISIELWLSLGAASGNTHEVRDRIGAKYC